MPASVAAEPLAVERESVTSAHRGGEEALHARLAGGRKHEVEPHRGAALVDREHVEDIVRYPHRIHIEMTHVMQRQVHVDQLGIRA